MGALKWKPVEEFEGLEGESLAEFEDVRFRIYSRMDQWFLSVEPMSKGLYRFHAAPNKEAVKEIAESYLPDLIRLAF